MINFLKKAATAAGSVALASFLAYELTFLIFDLHTGAGSMGNIAIFFPLLIFFFGFFMTIRIYCGDYFLEEDRLDAFKQAWIDLLVVFALLVLVGIFLFD